MDNNQFNNNYCLACYLNVVTQKFKLSNSFFHHLKQFIMCNFKRADVGQKIVVFKPNQQKPLANTTLHTAIAAGGNNTLVADFVTGVLDGNYTIKYKGTSYVCSCKTTNVLTFTCTG